MVLVLGLLMTLFNSEVNIFVMVTLHVSEMSSNLTPHKGLYMRVWQVLISISKITIIAEFKVGKRETPVKLAPGVLLKTWVEFDCSPDVWITTRCTWLNCVKYGDWTLLGYDVVLPGNCLPASRRTLLSPSSEYSLKVEAASFSETL